MREGSDDALQLVPVRMLEGQQQEVLLSLSLFQKFEGFSVFHYEFQTK